MKYTVKENQTIIDLAIQLYGKPGAVERLIRLNPELADRDPAWDIDAPLVPGSTINYEEEGNEKRVLKELDGKVIISE